MVFPMRVESANPVTTPMATATTGTSNSIYWLALSLKPGRARCGKTKTDRVLWLRVLLLAGAATLSGCSRDSHVVAFITTKTHPEITLAVIQNNEDDIVLRMTMVNRDEKAFPLLRWNLPEDGELTNALFEVTRNGAPVPYRGKMVKRSVSDQDYLQIKPGEQRSATIALAQGYDVKPRGRYTIQYRAWNQYTRNIPDKKLPVLVEMSSGVLTVVKR